MRWSNGDSLGVGILLVTAFALSVMYHVHSLNAHKDIAYIAYRTMIGCHEVDAIDAFGHLPPGMQQPTQDVIDRCTGVTAGYDDRSDYYYDDSREFEHLLKRGGW